MSSSGRAVTHRGRSALGSGLLIVILSACSPRAAAPATNAVAAEPNNAREPASMPIAAPAPEPKAPEPTPLGAKASPRLPDDQPPPTLEGAPSSASAEQQNSPFRSALVNPRSAIGTPAARHANLSPASCRAELKKRKLPTTPARGAARGIATPVRIGGSLRTVRFLTPAASSRYGMLDCRLVLALDEMAEVLATHGVVAVRIDNFYRPAAHLSGRRTRSQHAYGLAADIVGFTLADGRNLLVERDYRGARGSPSCGPESSIADPTDEAVAIRNIVCDLAAKGIFHHMLTPNYDAAHEDHLHLDIKRGDRAVIVR